MGAQKKETWASDGPKTFSSGGINISSLPSFFFDICDCDLFAVVLGTVARTTWVRRPNCEIERDELGSTPVKDEKHFALMTHLHYDSLYKEKKWDWNLFFYVSSFSFFFSSSQFAFFFCELALVPTRYLYNLS